MKYCYLEAIRGSIEGERYFIPDGAVSIGRSNQNTIVIPSIEKSVSGHHAVIYKSPEKILLHDFQSTNGTFVNEKRIDEMELTINSIVGLGRDGPRFRVLASDVELATGRLKKEERSPRSTDDLVFGQNGRSLPADTGNGDETGSNVTTKKINFRFHRSENTKVPTSETSEVERKIIKKKLDPEDMIKLMKEGGRVERIISRGELGITQSSLLGAALEANRKIMQQWRTIVVALLFVCMGTFAFLAIRHSQYQSIVSKAHEMKLDLDKYDNEIAAARKGGGKSDTDLKKMIEQMEEKNRSLNDLKSQIDWGDFDKIYTDPLEQHIDDILLRFGETDYHIPPEMVGRVRHHLTMYSTKLNKTVTNYLARRRNYFPAIHRIFREKNLPPELAYIAMLESGLNSRVLSSAGAAGMWQFMPETGRRYGLVINDTIDERFDFEKSTRAAAEYFRDLIGIFGGKSAVMLCMAAYNAGEGRIMSALKKIDNPLRNRDFWYIYRRGYLAEETNEYIPKVMAFIVLSEHPLEYGFTAVDVQKAGGASPSNQMVDTSVQELAD